MSTAAIDVAAPKRRRGMLGFYVAGFLLLGLALFGAWFWNAWTNWQFDEPEARRRQAEAARQLGVPVETTVDLGGGVTLELVLIPAGMFDMGSPDGEAGRSSDEGPLHRVRISRAFYIGKSEVTQEQWEKAMGTNPSAFKGPKLPVECVSWDACQEFLRRLEATGLRRAGPRVSGLKPQGYRLPTEAEWEWACRAGTRTRFCFGDADARLGEYAWYDANSGNTTHPVGEKRPNAWGLHDCHGNVWEWCADWGGEYGAPPWPGKFRWVRDPTGPTSGSWRVLRGGSWNYAPPFCRSPRRFRLALLNRGGIFGLRVVVSAGAGVD
jgi:formylglycine-generating enzyme required for sulfatase activity